LIKLIQVVVNCNYNLFYSNALPEDLICKCPILSTIPRKARDVIYSKPWQEIVDGDAFLKEIMDAAASLAFPHFGFGGWKEHYTSVSPVWRLSYALPVWARLLEDEIGWGLQALMLIPSSTEIPYFDVNYINDIMKRVVKRGIAEQGWQPILDNKSEPIANWL
jgi:hypothetical protein